METILLIYCAIATVVVCAQAWSNHELHRECEMYLNRAKLYCQRWEDSERARKAQLEFLEAGGWEPANVAEGDDHFRAMKKPLMSFTAPEGNH